MRCQTVKTQDMCPTSDRLHVILVFHQLTLFKPFKTSDRSCRFLNFFSEFKNVIFGLQITQTILKLELNSFLFHFADFKKQFWNNFISGTDRNNLSSHLFIEKSTHVLVPNWRKNYFGSWTVHILITGFITNKAKVRIVQRKKV